MPNENDTTKPSTAQKLDAGGDWVRRLVRLSLGSFTQVGESRCLQVMHWETITLEPIVCGRAWHAMERSQNVRSGKVFDLFGKRHAQILPQKKNNAMRKIILAISPHCVYSSRMSNTNQLASLKVGANSIIVAEKYVVVRIKRDLYRLGELCGDWIMRGTLQEVEARIAK